MKAAVILFVVFAYLQVEVRARAVEHLVELEPEEQCVNELKLNKIEIQRLNDLEIAPEDNADFNKFIGCYYTKMGWLNEKGDDVNYDKFRDAVAYELKNKEPAVQRLLKQIMLSIVDNCEKNPPPKGRTIGETVVKVRNCIMGNLYEQLED